MINISVVELIPSLFLDESEQRAVEYTLRELCTKSERKQGAVHQHNKYTHWRDDADYQPTGFP